MKKVLTIILGIMMIACGAFLITRPLEAFSVLGYVMGVALLVNGITNVILWFNIKKIAKPSVWYLVSGILSIIFAFCIFGDVLFKFAVETVLMYIIAVWFIITGFIRIKHAFDMRGMYKNGDESCKYWWLILIAGILLFICGIISIGNPIILMLGIGINIGINMMICGMDLITLGVIL